ncbi:MAG: GFA family protein [Proteobacteria bacterium]|nr:MAG: GFA family protein [Pseudomonadota bacterium]
MTQLKGSCLCGAVNYEIEGDAKAFYLCHCSRCRKFSGTAHASNLFVKARAFHWLTGEQLVKHFAVEGTRFAKNFCGTCASPVPFVNAEGHVTIPAGGLDSATPLMPMAHIYCGSRADWDDGFAGLPRRETFES